MGRTKIDYPKDWVEIYSKYRTRDMTGNSAIAMLGLKRITFYKMAKQYEEK
ncbi:hypothetical protein [Clostridium sp.]